MAVTGAVGLRGHGHPPLLGGRRRATWTPSTGRCSRSGARTSASWATLDERFFGDDQLDRWWSLVLRDGPDLPADGASGDRTGRGRGTLGEDAPASRTSPGAPSRWTCRSTPRPPCRSAPEPAHEGEAARRRKRDLYRLIDRFTGRPDLLPPTVLRRAESRRPAHPFPGRRAKRGHGHPGDDVRTTAGRVGQ